MLRIQLRQIGSGPEPRSEEISMKAAGQAAASDGG
jgi:hypothetical protein